MLTGDPYFKPILEPYDADRSVFGGVARGAQAFRAQIWVGCRVTDRGDYSLDHIRIVCQDFVNEEGWCVSVTPTQYIYGSPASRHHSDENEPGACVGILRYLRFGENQDHLRNQTLKLASHLLVRLQQAYVTIVFESDNEICLLQNPERIKEIEEGREKKRARKKVSWKDQPEDAVWKPWGWYKDFKRSLVVVTKILCIKPGHQISKQKHRFRKESWTVLQGTGHMTLGEGSKAESLQLVPQSPTMEIPVGTVHCLRNNGKTDLLVAEVQLATGDKGVCDETDIIRLEDPYNR